MIYPIVIYGSQVLRNVSEDITPDYPELKKLIEDMWITLAEAEGVGLAAPQIGVHKKVIVVRNGNSFFPMINPMIIKKSGRKFVNNEGCLSLEGSRNVERFPTILVSYTDRNGKRVTKTYNGLLSVIVQHEVDHLNGKLI